MGRGRYAVLAKEPEGTYHYRVEVVGSAVRLTWDYHGRTERKTTEYCTPEEAVVWARDKIFSKMGAYSVWQGNLEPRRALIPVEELLAPGFAEGKVLVYLDTETTGLGVADRLVQWGMLVAYNAAFDRNMLVSAFEAHGLAGEVEKVYRGQYRFVDAMPQKKFPWPKLVDLYQQLVVAKRPPAEGAALAAAVPHDALGDVRMMKAVLDKQRDG